MLGTFRAIRTSALTPVRAGDKGNALHPPAGPEPLRRYTPAGRLDAFPVRYFPIIVPKTASCTGFER